MGASALVDNALDPLLKPSSTFFYWVKIGASAIAGNGLVAVLACP